MHFPGGANGYATDAYKRKNNNKYLDSVRIFPDLTLKECKSIQRLPSHGKYVPWQSPFKCFCRDEDDTDPDQFNYCVVDPHKRDEKVVVEFQQEMPVRIILKKRGQVISNRVKIKKGVYKATLFGGTSKETKKGSVPTS